MLIIRTVGICSRTQRLIRPGLHFPGKGLLASRLDLRISNLKAVKMSERRKEKRAYQPHSQFPGCRSCPLAYVYTRPFDASQSAKLPIPTKSNKNKSG